MKTILLFVSFLFIFFLPSKAQLNADFTWCPVYDSSAQLCCIQFEDLSTDTGGTITNYFYIFGDGMESTSMDPYHCYVVLGTYVVYQFVTDNNGITDTAIHQLTISSLDTAGCNCDSLIGVNEIRNIQSVSWVVPNPFSDQATVVIEVPEAFGKCTLAIYDIAGNRLRNEIIDIAQGINTIDVSRKNLSEAIYFYDIRTPDGKLASGKLIVH